MFKIAYLKCLDLSFKQIVLILEEIPVYLTIKSFILVAFLMKGS